MVVTHGSTGFPCLAGRPAACRSKPELSVWLHSASIRSKDCTSTLHVDLRIFSPAYEKVLPIRILSSSILIDTSRSNGAERDTTGIEEHTCMAFCFSCTRFGPECQLVALSRIG